MSKTLQEKQEAQRRLRQVVDVVCPKCKQNDMLEHFECDTNNFNIIVDTIECCGCNVLFKVTYEPTKIEGI